MHSLPNLPVLLQNFKPQPTPPRPASAGLCCGQIGAHSVQIGVAARKNRQPSRRDISVLENSGPLAERLRDERNWLADGSTFGLNRNRHDKRIGIRKALIGEDKSDPNGFERVIGESDLLSVNFFDKGKRAAAAVCRIHVPEPGGSEWFGTGFLVGPRLMMTNHHVLGSMAEANQANAEFGYEHDADGALHVPQRFKLAPSEIFFTDSGLDVTLVAVVPLSDNSVPIERYGRLPLIPLSGKALHGENVTIIQHPGGAPKQIAIRASQIIEFGKDDIIPGLDAERFIHYTTDTEPGSSGSPVLNDQWQVVALHHKAVPAPLPPDGQPVEEVWIANEGVRVSAIYISLGIRATLTRQTRGIVTVVRDDIDRVLERKGRCRQPTRRAGAVFGRPDG